LEQRVRVDMVRTMGASYTRLSRTARGPRRGSCSRGPADARPGWSRYGARITLDGRYRTFGRAVPHARHEVPIPRHIWHREPGDGEPDGHRESRTPAPGHVPYMSASRW